MTAVPLGFLLDPLNVSIDSILPSRIVPEGLLNTRKYQQIRSSIETVGLIEPLTVAAEKSSSGARVLLDGHLRLLALRELGYTSAPCLASTDDETYTYNNRVNRLSTIQEHKMMVRAVQRGVEPARLAKALNVDVRNIEEKLIMLNGVCPEVVELLKDQEFSPRLGTILRKMKPTRQVECVELMLASNNISMAYAKGLLIASPPASLLQESKTRKIRGVTTEQMAMMEREMGNLHGHFKTIEQTYGQDVLNLVVATGYIKRLVENTAIVKYLRQNQPDLLTEFRKITEAASLEV